jgi:hypothetical protein
VPSNESKPRSVNKLTNSIRYLFEEMDKRRPSGRLFFGRSHQMVARSLMQSRSSRTGKVRVELVFNRQGQYSRFQPCSSPANSRPVASRSAVSGLRRPATGARRLLNESCPIGVCAKASLDLKIFQPVAVRERCREASGHRAVAEQRPVSCSMAVRATVFVRGRAYHGTP